MTTTFGVNYAKYDQNGYIYEVGRIEDKFVHDMIDRGEPVIYINPPRNIAPVGFRVDLSTKEIIDLSTEYSEPESLPSSPPSPPIP